MARKYKAFTSLSRRQRRAKVQRIKNLIHRERERCGGLYYDDGITPVSMIGGWTWSDIAFLGNTPDVYWNATIITVADQVESLISSMAFDEASAMLSEQQQETEFKLEFTEHFNEEGVLDGYRAVPSEPLTYPQFGGLTFAEYADKREKEIARDNPPAGTPGYSILTGYRSGIGLEIIVDAPELSREVINAALRSFLAGDMPAISSK